MEEDVFSEGDNRMQEELEEIIQEEQMNELIEKFGNSAALSKTSKESDIDEALSKIA